MNLENIETMSQEDIAKLIDEKTNVLQEELKKVLEEKNSVINSKEMQLLEDKINISEIANMILCYYNYSEFTELESQTMFYRMINKENVSNLINDYNEILKIEEKDYLLFIVGINLQIDDEINVLRKNELPCDIYKIIEEFYTKNNEELKRRFKKVESSLELQIIYEIIDIENNLKILKILGLDTEKYTNEDIRNKKHINPNTLLFSLNTQIQNKLNFIRNEVLEALHNIEEKESQIELNINKFEEIKSNPGNFKEILYEQLIEENTDKIEEEITKSR